MRNYKPGDRIELDPAEVIIPEGRLVSRQDPHIDDLASSMSKLGQISPIGVYFNSEGQPVLIYGRHRTEGCRQLGRKVIADVIDPAIGEAKLRAMEAAENLSRLQLSATQRAEHVKAVLAVYSAEIGRDVSNPRERQLGDREQAIKQIQAATKVSRTPAHIMLESASLSEGVLRAVRATPALDSGNFLTTLAQLPNDDARFKRIAAEQAALGGSSRRKVVDPADAARMAANMLRQALTPAERASFTGLLSSTTSKHLAIALSKENGDE
jgi:hypothetical protein